MALSASLSGDNLEAFKPPDSQYYSTVFDLGSEGATLEGVNFELLPERYSPFIHAPAGDGGLPSVPEIPPITEPFSGYPDLPVAEALRPQATTPSTVMPYGHSSLPDHALLEADPQLSYDISSGGAAFPSCLDYRCDSPSDAIWAYNHGKS
ncbi:hypothetical protein TRAPUB_9420 [Trametes pubescens]|uniref:Uncharacterized protein n=1 Tax=Trametes pubescens TaxID=154538 RepID=A0A1M2W2L9_TRAPU|nr:hypothetical protein TRAPUB_9420 [Trametes pubescens]